MLLSTYTEQWCRSNGLPTLATGAVSVVKATNVSFFLNCFFSALTVLPALCKSAQCSGYTVDGSFQQYAVSYTSQLSLIPDGLPLDDAAPILCAGVTVYKAIKESNAHAGEYVVVLGAGGGLGHLAGKFLPSW